VGLAQAISDYVLVLDDDVYLRPDCVGRLLEAAMQTGAAAVCPRIITYPGEPVIQCSGASVHFTGMLILEERDLLPARGSAARHACGGFIGACVLFKRQVLMELGGFDEDYFFYFEDLELSLRLRALGHSIWCEPNAVALHERGSGTPGLSFRGAGNYPWRRAYYTLRHRWLTLLLHYRPWTLILLSPALALYELAALAECLIRGWLGAWLSALWSLGSHLRSILRRRRRWQQLRRVPDSALLTGGTLPFAPGFAERETRATLVAVLGRTLNAVLGDRPALAVKERLPT
jgi:GT2 family glycosyltransferase